MAGKATETAQFQLTPSRRATKLVKFLKPQIFISTHALTEGDKDVISIMCSVDYFNSRPHGGRLHLFRSFSPQLHFNSRPHGGRPQRPLAVSDLSVISTHALTEGDVCCRGSNHERMRFQLTPSRRATR